MILLIDNYDSFVYNLARYLAEMGCETVVVRNDRVTVAEVRTMRPQAVIISPGPCTPREAGVSVPLVRELGAEVPILGVCLGHQAIAAALGGRVVRAPEPVHGRTSLVRHYEATIFAGLPNPLRATRYHSLIVEEESLPEELIVTARVWHETREAAPSLTKGGLGGVERVGLIVPPPAPPYKRGEQASAAAGIVMAVEHRGWPLFGVQFHPESVLTQSGHRLLANFLSIAGIAFAAPPADEFVAPSPEPEWIPAGPQTGWPPHL